MMNKRKGTLRQTIAGSIIIGCGIGFGWMFTVIYFKDKLYVWEPNGWILAADLIMSAAFILFGIVRAYNGIMRERRGK